MERVSIQDIANELGLSRNTISKALQGSDIVAYHTRQKIIKKAVEMGYTKIPEDIKADLEPGDITNKKILIISKREISEFWNRIVFGISEIVDKTGYSFMINLINEEDEKELVLPKEIQNRSVDGIICLSVFGNDYIDKLFMTDIPIVFYDAPIGGQRKDFGADIVLVDGFNSVYEIAERLILDGRKRLSFIGDISYCRTILDRWMGFRSALQANQIPIEEELCFVRHLPWKYHDDNEIGSCFNGLEALPDAVICANDDIARHVIRYLLQRGCDIPKDVAVTGFDDKMSWDLADISLTTVHVDNEYLGRRLTEQLLFRIENHKRPFETIHISTKPVFRKSSMFMPVTE